MRQFIPRYYASQARKEKKRITNEILRLARSQGIRFLSRGEGEQWFEAEPEKVRVRIGQSLRYLRRQQIQQQLVEEEGREHQRLMNQEQQSEYKEEEQKSGTDLSSIIMVDDQFWALPDPRDSE